MTITEGIGRGVAQELSGEMELGFAQGRVEQPQGDALVKELLQREGRAKGGEVRLRLTACGEEKERSNWNLAAPLAWVVGRSREFELREVG